MAKKIYIAEFDAHDDPYLRKLKGIETKTASMSRSVEGSISKINASYLKMAAGIAAVSTATNFIADSIAAYAEEEKAIKRLDVALGRNNRTLTQYAATLQKLTTYGDEQILDAMALIANYVKEEATIKKLTKATLDFATAKGLDLSSAAELVAKTVGSSTNALSRYGIEINTSATGTEKINQLLEKFAMFSGQAEGQADTYTGKLQQLNNQLGDLQEQIGQGVLPTLNEFSTALSDIATKLGTSGISDLLDKWLKLVTIVPRTGLSVVNFIGNALGLGGGSNLNPADFITNSESYSKILNGTSNLPGKKGSGAKRIVSGGRAGDFNSSVALTRPDSDISGLSYMPKWSLQMTETIVPELQDKFEVIGDSFVNKFGELNNIAHSFSNVLGIGADTFVGKIIAGIDTASQILGIISGIINISSGGVTSLFGLAEGGTVVNKHGKLSYVPIPKFARGGSYVVPPGYSNDSGLIRVQSGERVDVTPSSQVPMISKMLGEIKGAILAGNMNSARKGKQPMLLNLTLDGEKIASAVFGYENNFNKRGVDKTQLRAGRGI